MTENFSRLKKHINVSHETLEKLVIYFDLLNVWQKKMNLVSKNSLENAEIQQKACRSLCHQNRRSYYSHCSHFEVTSTGY